jgi:hypothetical protein
MRRELGWNLDAVSTPKRREAGGLGAGVMWDRTRTPKTRPYLREQNFCSGIHNGVIPHPDGAQARSYSE